MGWLYRRLATINIENRGNKHTWRMPVNLIADTRHAGYPRYRTRLAAIGENRNRCTGHTRQFSPIAAIGVKNRQVCRRLVAGDTQSDFIRRSPRLAKIARCARCSDCDFRQTPRSAYKIADIWHVWYRRLKSPAFAKCPRSRDFLPSSLRIVSKVNQSGWAILSYEQC